MTIVLQGNEVRIGILDRARPIFVQAGKIPCVAARILRGAAKLKLTVVAGGQLDGQAVDGTVLTVEDSLHQRGVSRQQLDGLVGASRIVQRVRKTAHLSAVDLSELKVLVAFELDGRGRLGSRDGRLADIAGFGNRAVRVVVPRLLRLHVGGGVLDRQRNVLGLLAVAAIANEDIAIIADRVGEGAVGNLGSHSSGCIVVDNTDRRGVLIEFVLCACGAAVCEGAVFNRDRHLAGLLVGDVHRSTVIRELAVFDRDSAVSRGMND